MSSTAFDSIIEQIVSDSPSGEILEVYNDLLAIAGESAKESILDAIEQYNVKNTVAVDVDGNSVLLSKYNKEGTKFYDPANGISFSVDHLNRKGLDVEPYSVKLTEEQQSLLESLQKYASTNFSGDVTLAVYPIADSNKVVIILISTRNNPSNFYNGNWKSEYIYDIDSTELTGTIDVHVHYYEDGNVSFRSNKEVEIIKTKDVVKTIQEIEKDFEDRLDVSFSELNEKKFKTLRRRLPITRSKVNWGKAIGTYRLGKDAAQGN